MNIVFMGTPDFAVPSLKTLLDMGETVLGVFTQPDKPKGRGHKLTSTPVKQLALEYDLPVYQPATLRSGEAEEVLRTLNPELIVVVAYGKILPKEILELPKYGCINVHGSLLPKYRGAAPIQWTVLNGDKLAGVTTMYMAEGLDTGDMLLKSEVPVKENETASELYDRLSFVGADLLKETVLRLKQGDLTAVPQNDEESCYAPMLSKEMSAIDFNKSAEAVHQQILGLSDWPCAVTEYDGKRLKVYRSTLCDRSGKPGTVLDNKRLVVACGSGSVELTEVQYEGSKRMLGDAFMRGRHISAGDQLGKSE